LCGFVHHAYQDGVDFAGYGLQLRFGEEPGQHGWLQVS